MFDPNLHSRKHSDLPVRKSFYFRITPLLVQNRWVVSTATIEWLENWIRMLNGGTPAVAVSSMTCNLPCRQLAVKSRDNNCQEIGVKVAYAKLHSVTEREQSLSNDRLDMVNSNVNGKSLMHPPDDHFEIPITISTCSYHIPQDAVNGRDVSRPFLSWW